MRKRFLTLILAGVGALAVMTGGTVGCSSTGSDDPFGGDGDAVQIGDGDTGPVGGDGDSVGSVSGETTACSGLCVDVLTDPSNCGDCGVVCDAGSQCRSGTCAGCAGGQTDCGGICVDTDSDRGNCGACGASCSLGSECVAGACSSCADGQEECNGACVDTTNNLNNCGGCGQACTGSEVCSNGACVENTCGGANELPCGANGACIDVQWDNENCGACGQTCAAATMNTTGGNPALTCIGNNDGGLSRCGCHSGEPCGQFCVQTASDPMNCGGCGIECPSAQYCESGVCRCGGGQVLCENECKNPEQCGSGGGASAQAPQPQPLSAPGYELLAEGDGSVDCSPSQPIDPGTGGTGNVDPGTGGSTGNPVGDNPDAGEHCGGEDWHQGKSTWYELATDLVHCSYPTGSLPQFYGAINDAQYAVGDVCGACVEIEANGKTLEVEIVDECPYVGNETWCYAGSNHIDLNPAAFEYFEPRVTGVFDMKWRYVPCSDPGELEYTFKAGSSIYWTGIMIRNHPVPLAAVEVAGADGVFKALERQEYNFWLLESGFGMGPYTLRVTDTSGAVIEKAGIPSLPGSELASNETSAVGGQLASCQ